MTPIEEIKKDTKEIENSIKKLLGDFIEKNGHCNINISVDTDYYTGVGREFLMNLGVKMNVKI